jgi:hypothetical protein
MGPAKLRRQVRKQTPCHDKTASKISVSGAKARRGVGRWALGSQSVAVSATGCGGGLKRGEDAAQDPGRARWTARNRHIYRNDIGDSPAARVALTEEATRAADGSWVAHVKAPPIEGRANQELIDLIAEHFHCVKAAVCIKSGASGRMKLVRIEA